MGVSQQPDSWLLSLHTASGKATPRHWQSCFPKGVSSAFHNSLETKKLTLHVKQWNSILACLSQSVAQPWCLLCKVLDKESLKKKKKPSGVNPPTNVSMPVLCNYPCRGGMQTRRKQSSYAWKLAVLVGGCFSAPACATAPWGMAQGLASWEENQPFRKFGVTGSVERGGFRHREIRGLLRPPSTPGGGNREPAAARCILTSNNKKGILCVQDNPWLLLESIKKSSISCVFLGLDKCHSIRSCSPGPTSVTLLEYTPADY